MSLCDVCMNSITCTQCVYRAYLWANKCRCDFGYLASNNQCVVVSYFIVTTDSYMRYNGDLYFSFNQRLQNAPSASQFTVVVNFTSYDSSNFSLIVSQPLISYTIVMLDKNIFEGSFYAHVIFPSSPNTLVSEANIPLSSTEVKIPINPLLVPWWIVVGLLIVVLAIST
jgi:hypothetical protein